MPLDHPAAGLVLAAGRSSRYRLAGGDAETKLVASFRGEPLVRHAARAALAAGLDPVIVVTGHARKAVEQALSGWPVRFAHNASFQTGLASSLSTGLAALPPGTEAVVVLLGDMPLVSPDLVRALLSASQEDAGADAVVPVCNGQRGNPVLLRQALFGVAMSLAGDEGARRLLRDPAHRVLEVPLADEAARLDADDPAALQALAGPGEPGPAAP